MARFGQSMIRSTRGSDLTGRNWCQAGEPNLVDLGREAGAADDHRVRECHVDHVHDELAGATDIRGGVLLDALAALEPEDDDRWLVGEDVEEAHRRGVVVAGGGAGGDEGDRAGTDEVGEEPVAVPRRQTGEVEVHEPSPSCFGKASIREVASATCDCNGINCLSGRFPARRVDLP